MQLAKKIGGGSWETVNVTILDTTHTYTDIVCYKNDTLKLAYITGTTFSLSSGTNTAFSGLPAPSGGTTAKMPATDTVNKAGLLYIRSSGNIDVPSGVNSYLNFSGVYPID